MAGGMFAAWGLVAMGHGEPSTFAQPSNSVVRITQNSASQIVKLTVLGPILVYCHLHVT